MRRATDSGLAARSNTHLARSPHRRQLFEGPGPMERWNGRAVNGWAVARARPAGRNGPLYQADVFFGAFVGDFFGSFAGALAALAGAFAAFAGAFGAFFALPVFGADFDADGASP